MRILIFGASGGTGRLLVRHALRWGHGVTAVARHLETLGGPMSRLVLRPADVRDASMLRSIAAGHDAAISMAGGSVKGHGRIYSEGTRTIVRALEEADVRRFVCVSSGGVRPKDRGLPLWYRLAIPLFMRDLYQDMRVMKDVVRGSMLDWTLVRPHTSWTRDRVAASEWRTAGTRRGWRIDRADLAEFLLDQLESDRWLKAAPTVAY